MINICAIDHIVLRTNDVDGLIAFYCGALGCKVERRLAELGLTQLRAGNALIDIVAVDSVLGKKGGQGPSDSGRNLDHFCLVIDAMPQQQLIEYLDQHHINHGPFERRYGSQGYGESIYLNDPQGNTVELTFKR